MNTKTKLLKPVANILVLAIFGFILNSNALADKYRVKIKRIGPESTTGDVIIRVTPGAGEKDFSGKALVMLAGSDLGTNRGMATLLTAVTINADVVIDVPNPPSFDNIQIVNSINLIAP